MTRVTPTLAGHLAAVLTVAETRDWPMPTSVLLRDGEIALEFDAADHMLAWAEDAKTDTHDDLDGRPWMSTRVEVIDCDVMLLAPALSAVTA